MDTFWEIKFFSICPVSQCNDNAAFSREDGITIKTPRSLSMCIMYRIPGLPISEASDVTGIIPGALKLKPPIRCRRCCRPPKRAWRGTAFATSCRFGAKDKGWDFDTAIFTQKLLGILGLWRVNLFILPWKWHIAEGWNFGINQSHDPIRARVAWIGKKTFRDPGFAEETFRETHRNKMPHSRTGACYDWVTPCRKDALAKWSSRDQEGRVCDVRWGMLEISWAQRRKVEKVGLWHFICQSTLPSIWWTEGKSNPLISPMIVIGG